jgi:hypothetical protein
MFPPTPTDLYNHPVVVLLEGCVVAFIIVTLLIFAVFAWYRFTESRRDTREHRTNNEKSMDAVNYKGPEK